MINIIEQIREGHIASPAYVFDLDEFKRRASDVKKAFGQDIDICFSIKANPFLLAPFLDRYSGRFPSEFSKVEVCSPGELEICKKLNVPPEMIIFSGVNKRFGDVSDALDIPGIDAITVESEVHLRHIQNYLDNIINDKQSSNNDSIGDGDTVRRIPVLIRLSDESQFGMDEEVLVDIIKNRNSYAGIDFVGIHYFTGTGKKKAKEIIKELERIKVLFKRLKEEAGYTPKRLEYGAGLAVDYFNQDEAEAIKWEEALLLEASTAIKDFAREYQNDNPDFKLTVEMGRFFAASSGYYITRIDDVKTNDGTNYIIIDGGLHQMKYDGQLQGMKIPFTTHVQMRGIHDANKHDCSSTNSQPTSGEEKTPWTVCGSLCTTNDVLVRNLELSDPTIDDCLVFHKTGAYSVTEGMSLFLSRDLPSVYIFDNENGLQLLRQGVSCASLNMPDLI